MAINIYEVHEAMTAHLFPAYSSTDKHFLALALCGEVGEIANKVKKEWRDGVNLTEEIKEELCDARVYLELLAKCYDMEGDKLDMGVIEKLKKVAKKHAYRIDDAAPEKRIVAYIKNLQPALGIEMHADKTAAMLRALDLPLRVVMDMVQGPKGAWFFNATGLSRIEWPTTSSLKDFQTE